jgi:polyisoprenoid-binding protein YceI
MPPSNQVTSSAEQALRHGKAAGTWVLDASRTEVRLKTRSMWGMAAVNGVFREVTGDGVVSPSGEVTGTITVATQSLDTKNDKRDNHLRSADFFDAANHPAITFTVNEVKPSGSGVTVVGQLSVRDRTRPASFDALVSHFDGDEVHLDGELRVNRADFGLTWNQMGMASMKNTIIVHAVLTRQ